MQEVQEVSYRIDRNDKIVVIWGDWYTSAIEGNKPSLAHPASVIGKSVFDFISDKPTQQFYKTLFKKCRELMITQEIEYRCDSPTHKRFMRMVISPRENGSLDLINTTLLEVPFIFPVFIKTVQPGSDDISAHRCSICNDLKLVGTRHWIKPSSFRFQENNTFTVTHDVCDACQEIEFQVPA